MTPARIVLLSWLLGLVFAVGNSAAQKVNVSFSSLNGIQSPLWIAQDAGFFKKHRLDVRVEQTAGGETVVEEMLAGRLQMAISAPGAVLRANQSGVDFTYIGALSNRIDYVLIAQKEIKSFRELRGKKIAIGRFGSGPDYAARMVFAKLGMRVGKDVFFTETFGGQPTRLAMLQSGAIDAVVLTPPHTLRAKQLGFNAALDFTSVIPHFFSSGYFTRRKYIRDNPRTYEDILKALIDSTKYVFADASGTIKILARHLKINDEAFLRTYYRDVLLDQLDRDLYPDPQGVDMLMEQERWANPKAAKVKPEDFIDTSILDKLRKEGY